MGLLSFLKSIPEAPLIQRSKSKAVLLLALGLLLILILQTLASLPLHIIVNYRQENGSISKFGMNEFIEHSDLNYVGLHNNLGYFLLLLSFVILIVGFIAFYKFLYKLPWISMISPNQKVRWKRLLFGFGLMLSLILVTEFVSYILHPENYTWGFNRNGFALQLLLTLSLLPIQVLCEELILRGYLLPHFSHFTNRPLIGVLLTAALFGLMHYNNPEVAEYGLLYMMSYYMVAGIFLGLITVLDNGLELAIGAHFAINFHSAMIMSYDAAVIPTDTLWVMNETYTTELLVMSIVMAVGFIFIASKKYNWSFKHSLFTKLYSPDEITTISNSI